MGFFSYAYVVEGSLVDDGVEFSVTAYRAEGPALFSWGPGKRAPGLQGLASNTLFCEVHLDALPGYPREYRDSADGRAESATYQIEESFFPPHRNEPVLFHFVLPSCFVPRPDLEPFTVPQDASLAQREDRLVITSPTVGGGDIRFTIGALRPEERFADYELSRLLRPRVNRSVNIEFELNLGIVKLTLK